MTVSRLKTIVTWMVVSNVAAVMIGVLTLPWRSELIAAIEAVGIPQPTPAETIVFFVLTVGLFYLWAEMLDREGVGR